MDAIIERCCGLDVHRDSIMACLLTGRADEKPEKQVRTFGTMSQDLDAMVQWLCEHQCTLVAMEGADGDSGTLSSAGASQDERPRPQIRERWEREEVRQLLLVDASGKLVQEEHVGFDGGEEAGEIVRAAVEASTRDVELRHAGRTLTSRESLPGTVSEGGRGRRRLGWWR